MYVLKCYLTTFHFRFRLFQFLTLQAIYLSSKTFYIHSKIQYLKYCLLYKVEVEKPRLLLIKFTRHQLFLNSAHE